MKKINKIKINFIHFRGESQEEEGSFTIYLYAHKTIEDCTGAEQTGVELASKVNRISYTGETGWEIPHQLWLIKTLPRLSQTKQDTTRQLPELCTEKSQDKRNLEDTKGTLQVLVLCTIKRVVFIVDISNTRTNFQVPTPPEIQHFC